MNAAVIGATHVLCSIGNGTEQVWASARAGIGRIASSSVMDRHFEPIQMGLVPEDALGALPPEVDALPLPSRARRILRLAGPSLKAVAADLPGPVRLLVGLPQIGGEDGRWLKHVPAYLAALTGAPVDRQQSVVVPLGRAAALVALEQALGALEADPDTPVVVGGVDSFLDFRLLAELDAEGRILGPRVMDGFIPGEGAAFYVLHGNRNGARHENGRHVVVRAAASTQDPGHRYGDAPARGEGLALALEQLRQRVGALPNPVATTFAGFNGENFDAKLWGVARLRHNDLFAPDMHIEHPADKYGDAGAATGAILVALAAQAQTNGARRGPSLVWAASDRESRACALLSPGAA